MPAVRILGERVLAGAERPRLGRRQLDRDRARRREQHVVRLLLHRRTRTRGSARPRSRRRASPSGVPAGCGSRVSSRWCARQRSGEARRWSVCLRRPLAVRGADGREAAQPAVGHRRASRRAAAGAGSRPASLPPATRAAAAGPVRWDGSSGSGARAAASSARSASASRTASSRSRRSRSTEPRWSRSPSPMKSSLRRSAVSASARSRHSPPMRASGQR